MSTTGRRLTAVTVAAIIVILTGVVIGLVSPQTTCRTAAASPPLPPGAAPTVGADAQAPPVTSANNRQGAQQVICSVGRFEAVPAVVGVVGGFTACAAIFVLLSAAVRRGPPAAARPPVAPADPTVPVDGGAPAPDRHPAAPAPAEADRAALIRACIHVRDRTTSPALADRLATALHDAGVRALEPAGARFDPAHHEAGGAAPSGDPAKVGTIAAVDAPGYADRDGRLLRVPVVTVYRPATPTDPEDR